MSIFDDIGRGLRGLPRQAQDAINGAVHQIHDLGQDAINQINGLVAKAKKELYDVQGEVAINLRGEADKGVAKIQGALGDVEGTVKNTLTKVWHELEEEAQKEVTKKALISILHLVEKIPIKSMTTQISFIAFQIDSPGDKIAAIEEAVKNPPTDHSGIIDLAKKLGAGSVTFDLDFEFFTSLAEAGEQIEVGIDDAIGFVDYAVKEIESFAK